MTVISISRLAVLFAALLSLSAAGRAQNLYGSLTGNVTDLTEAAVPGAQVEALNTETGVSRQVLTDDRGAYSFNDLQTGVYKVTIRSAAFSVLVRDRIPVEAGNVRRLDARLQVSAVSETVTVDA